MSARLAVKHFIARATAGSIPSSPQRRRNRRSQSMKVKRFSTEYFDLIDKYGRDAAKFLATDEPVTVELGGQVYEID